MEGFCHLGRRALLFLAVLIPLFLRTLTITARGFVLSPAVRRKNHLMGHVFLSVKHSVLLFLGDMSIPSIDPEPKL